MKRFNYTGTCIPKKHYMVDTSNKLNQIRKHVDFGEYFTINRPRQYGKTTTIFLLKKELINDYVVIKMSFERMGDEESFSNTENFSKSFINNINRSLKLDGREDLLIPEEKATSFDHLSDIITEFILRADKKVVLLIDEVDKASNYSLFLSFLGMLRDKYLKSNEEEDYTFYSVILAGVHDIKNIKMKMTGQTKTQYNSPWNIAVDFNVEMSFTINEIQSMLIEYENDKKTGMNAESIAKEIYAYTSGYPYLVSKLCFLMDEKLECDFSIEGLKRAVKTILDESNTLFDDLIKNINNYPEVRELIERLILDGEEVAFNPDVYSLSLMFGIVKENNETKKLMLHNKIFEIRLYNYLIEMRGIREGKSALKYKYEAKFINEAGELDMELVLEKFQELMKAEYREIDEKFVEREGRLLFLAFIKPIINGVGFYFVEPETRKSNRMDIVITYNKKKYVIELKIWRGGKYEQEGKEQLYEYLEAQNLDKGYMIFYNFNKNKEYIIDRTFIQNKEIFEIIV